jgi:uncharacterized protein
MILEGLITTLREDGSTHIAPMGPEVDDATFSRFLLKPFRSSQTYRHLKRTGVGVLHVHDDVGLIARAAVGRLTHESATIPAEQIDGRILADACRAYEFRIVNLEDAAERTRIECAVVCCHRLRDCFGFNRAQAAVIEAAILCTRFQLRSAADIAEDFARYRIIVNKTGGPREIEAMTFLEAYRAEMIAMAGVADA